MLKPPISLRRPLPLILALAALLALATWFGCSKDNNKNPVSPGGGGTPSTSFSGWLANGSQSGKLALTVNKASLAGRPYAGAGAATITATGTLQFSGTAGIALTGTFDDQTGALHLTGGGYTFSGTYSAGPPSHINGSYTGPSGHGSFTTESGGGSSFSVYSGSYYSSFSGSYGTFVFAVRGTALDGAATANGDSTGLEFSGTVTGTGATRPIAISKTVTNVYQLTANGTLDTSTSPALVSGKWKVDDFQTAQSDSGNWSGQFCEP